MPTLKRHIQKTLLVIFLSIFIPLFAIASVVFLVKLAAYTAVVQLSLAEMLKLFSFMVPELLFFTLPLAFFIAISLALHRLSNDNEMIVFFSLGVKPALILRTFISPALLLSVILLFDFFVLFPHAKILSSNFMANKKSEAKFNLSASEFGHKFGDWLLFIGSEPQKEKYLDVVLFNKNTKEEIFVSAKEAQILNIDGLLRLKLSKGEGYAYSPEKFTQIDFGEMYINDKLNSDSNAYKTPAQYWLGDNDGKRKKMFIFNTLFALFPLFSLFAALSIGIVHARHQKAKIYLFLFITIALYSAIIITLQGRLSYLTIPTVSILWLAGSYMLYRKQIVNKF